MTVPPFPQSLSADEAVAKSRVAMVAVEDNFRE